MQLNLSETQQTKIKRLITEGVKNSAETLQATIYIVSVVPIIFGASFRN